MNMHIHKYYMSTELGFNKAQVVYKPLSTLSMQK